MLTRSSRPIDVMSMPSKMILPAVGSTKRNKDSARVDLPDPVRPTMPIFSDGLVSKDTPLRTGSNSGAYLSTRSSTTSVPLVADGQATGGRFDSMTAGGSGGRSRYSWTRSTELRDCSSSVQNRRPQYNPRTYC